MKVKCDICQKELERDSWTVKRNKNFYCPLHRYSWASFTNRKYEVNERFFKKWTPKMAWALGLLATDGNVFPSQGRISLSLIDKSGVRRFKKTLDSKHPIKKIDNTSQFGKFFIYRIDIFSRKMCKDLLEVGIMPNKSRSILMPDIPLDLMADYVRGLVDGDGWFEVGDKKYIITKIGMGSVSFLEELRDILKELGFNSNLSYYKRMTVWHTYNQKFPKWLFQNKENCYLNSRYQQYQKCLKKLNYPKM